MWFYKNKHKTLHVYFARNYRFWKNSVKSLIGNEGNETLDQLATKGTIGHKIVWVPYADQKISINKTSACFHFGAQCIPSFHLVAHLTLKIEFHPLAPTIHYVRNMCRTCSGLCPEHVPHMFLPCWRRLAGKTKRYTTNRS